MQIETLMLVDDDEDDRDIFLSVLEAVAPEATCLIATNGQEALQKLNRGDILPEMIFLDLNMPLMGGKEFLREIRKYEDLQRIPIVILSTSSDKQTIAETKVLGAKKFITKPDRYSGWEETLKEVFNNSRL